MSSSHQNGLQGVLNDMGFTPSQIGHAVEAGCIDAQEALAFLCEGTPPAGHGGRPRQVPWDPPSPSPSQNDIPSAQSQPHSFHARHTSVHQQDSNRLAPSSSTHVQDLSVAPASSSLLADHQRNNAGSVNETAAVTAIGEQQTPGGQYSSAIATSTSNLPPATLIPAPRKSSTSNVISQIGRFFSSSDAQANKNPPPSQSLGASASALPQVEEPAGSGLFPPVTGQATTPVSSTNSNAPSAGSSTLPGRALTTSVSFADQSEDEQLRKVLELSRQEQHEKEMRQALQISKADAERSHPQTGDHEFLLAIQQSLNDTPRGSDVWTAADVREDPKSRRRIPENASVGLRNIGNTCYLNSLLQVYFNLAEFRKVILRYEPPSSMRLALGDTSSTKLATEQGTKDVLSRQTRETSHKSFGITASSSGPSSEKVVPPKSPSSVPAKHNVTASDAGNCAATSNPYRMPERARPADLRAVDFVMQLQRLFAKMCLGNQRFADPSDLVNTMCDANGNPIVIGSQQDASEFNSLFLDIVERGLSYDSGEENSTSSADQSSSVPFRSTNSPAMAFPPDPSSNPRSTSNSSQLLGTSNAIKRLFYAKFNQHVDLEDHGGQALTKIPPTSGETIALVVDATNRLKSDLMSGLEDYMRTRIEYSIADTLENRDAPSSSRNTRPAIKSVWFTSFAPVLTVYLQRVRYNRETAEAEKTHHRFTFPAELFVDRYLESNRSESEAIRETVSRLREEQLRLRDALRRLRRFPEKIKPHSMHDEEDEPRLSPQSQSRLQDAARGTISTANDPSRMDESSSLEDNSTDFSDDLQIAMYRVRQRVLAAMRASATDGDLFLLNGLDKVRAETVLEILNQIDTQDQGKMSSLENEISARMKSEAAANSSLNKINYKLHAILIHDGAPSSGHYWTFIRNPVPSSEADIWLKFNDTVVSCVSEGDMLLSSQGGKGHASAYCLIYVAKSIKPISAATGIGPDYSQMELDGADAQALTEEARKILPHRCILEVEQSNAEFDREVEEYEERYRRNEIERKGKEIITKAIVTLRKANASCSGFPASNTITSLGSNSESGSRPLRSCHARTLVEFCLYCDSRASALIHALSEAWSSIMVNDAGSVENDLLTYLTSPLHMERVYPPVGSIGAVNVKDVDAAEPALVLDAIAGLLLNVETEFPGDAALVPRSTSAEVAELFKGNVHISPELENAIEFKVYFSYALRAMCGLSLAMKEAFAGNWNYSLGYWLLVLRQGPSLYDTHAIAAGKTYMLQIFKSRGDMSFARRDEEAIYFLPTILKSVGSYISNITAAASAQWLLEQRLHLCVMYSLASQIVQTLESWPLEEPKVIKSSHLSDTRAVPDISVHLANGREILALLRPSLSDMNAPLPSTDEVLVELSKQIGVVIAQSTSERLATEYEKLLEHMHGYVVHGHDQVQLMRSSNTLLKTSNSSSDHAPVA